jgi:hypothetical protein
MFLEKTHPRYLLIHALASSSLVNIFVGYGGFFKARKRLAIIFDKGDFVITASAFIILGDSCAAKLRVSLSGAEAFVISPIQHIFLLADLERM